MKNVININVTGETGIGKSHVMATIEKALIGVYGINTQVCSYDLSVERNGVKTDRDMLKPKAVNTIFCITEGKND